MLQNVPQGFSTGSEAGSESEVRDLAFVQVTSFWSNGNRKKMLEKVCLTEAVWDEVCWNSDRLVYAYAYI